VRHQEIDVPPVEVPTFAPDPAPGPGNPLPADRSEPLIADRGEFMDALTRLRRGELLVHAREASDQRCVIGGYLLYTSWKPLFDFGLLDKLPPRPRQGRVDCYRLSARGNAFADKACKAWRQRPLWQRLAVRLVG
jgi:hypothetical protein